MSTGDSDESKPSVAEATPENGRSHVPISDDPNSLFPKFDEEAEAWLQDEDGDRPPCEVIILSRSKKSGGGFLYKVKYKDTQEVVKDLDGTDWFPEAQLKVNKPMY